jgi:predicted nucleic acid-binding protein
MKGLDTPVLVRLLHGDAGVRKAVRELEGEELATTEWNLLELEALARLDESPGRERRKSALENLRRRLTVVPLDERAVELAAREMARPGRSRDLIGLAVLACLASRGCDEVLTSGTSLSRKGFRGHLKVKVV